MKHRRFTFRKLRRFAVLFLKRLVPFKGRVGWELQIGALVVLLWHKDSRRPNGQSRLALWLDPHWRDFRFIRG
jgi:hypothetical protein